MDMEIFYNSFIPSFVATVLGGVVLTLLLFLVKEKLLPIVDISGRWYFTTTTVNTAYNPYRDMQLEYVAVIYREGNKIFGTTEKIYEISSTGEREYIEEDRKRSTLEGSIERYYLKKSKIVLHSLEREFSRESTSFHELLIQNEEKMEGYFTSMIADQSGEVTWQREPLLSQ